MDTDSLMTQFVLVGILNNYYTIFTCLIIDIDECIEGLRICGEPNTICVNTVGSSYCGCEKGYQRVRGICQGTYMLVFVSLYYMHGVVDVDECELPNRYCDHYCNNTDGSHTCSCMEGFDLNNDLVSCNGGY